MGTEAADDLALIRRAVEAEGLPILPEYEAGVLANLVIARRMAALVLDFELPDAAEPAPVFDPREAAR
jgi:Protein of unknown function (DUF4089)